MHVDIYYLSILLICKEKRKKKHESLNWIVSKTANTQTVAAVLEYTVELISNKRDHPKAEGYIPQILV